MNAPIRVLHYGMSSSVGGIESFIMNVYRKIDRSKIQFDFLTFEPQIAFTKEIEELGGKIYCLTSRRENFLDNYQQVNAFFKEHLEYKNVHFHFNTCSYIKPLIAASKSGDRNIITHSHNQWGGMNSRVKLFHSLNRPKVVKVSNYLFACSDIAGEYMFERKSMDSDNYKLLNNAIDAESYRYKLKNRAEMRKLLNIESNFVVGHVGRLSYQKNHEFLLDIFYQLNKLNKNAILLIIGEGELEEKIKRKINNLGLNNSVMMLGVRKDIPNILQAMDVFLFPSHFEGLPFTLVEAQAAGLPCIISDTISNQVCITANIVYKSLSSSPKTWADHILNLQDEFERRDTYNEIVNSGFDISTLVSFLEEVYTSKI